VDKIIDILLELIRKRSPGTVARVVAHLLMPGFVMAGAITGAGSASMTFDFRGPISVTELHTQIDSLGRLTPKPGIALTVEPVASEYRVPLNGGSTIWMSLDPKTARANDDRLVVTPTEVRATSPFWGVSDPVTVVVAGQASGDVLRLGGNEFLRNWRLEPRRSTAFLSQVLLVCVFSFGMSVAAVWPAQYSVEDAGAEARTGPD